MAPAPAPPSPPRAPPPRRCAYVTLFSDEAYLPGVVALAKSARRAGLRHPLIVMTTAGVGPGAAAAVAAAGGLLRRVESYHPPNVNKAHYVRALYAECWNKLWMWAWEDEFDRLIYLDADMIVLQNLDHLFALPPAPLYAVGDCYGGREEAAERDACCHFRPDAAPRYFNAGFYVMAPSRTELAAMEAALEAEGTAAAAWRFSEQDFLNLLFAGRWRHLPLTYNAQKRIKWHHPDAWDLGDIKVLHYVDDKPWSHRWSEENAAYAEEVELWWQIYGEEGGEVKEKVQGGPAQGMDLLRGQMAAAAAALAAQPEK